MQVLVSKENRQIKMARKLQEKKHRDQKGLFLIEGQRAVQELFIRPDLIETLFVSDNLMEVYEGDVQRLHIKQAYQVKADLMKYLCATETPQGIAAIARKPVWSPDKLLQPDSTVFFLDRIADPGNLGTIIRTAWALGIGVLLLSSNSTDPFSPKAVRASMGGIVKIPVYQAVSTSMIRELKEKGYQVLAADSKGNKLLYDINFNSGKSLIIFGSEAHGMSGDYSYMVDAWVKIPLQQEADSLNIAVAHGIFSSEIRRQRLYG